MKVLTRPLLRAQTGSERTVVVTHAFPGADDPDLGPDWINWNGGDLRPMQRVSQAAQLSGGPQSGGAEAWTANTFNQDMYGKIRISTWDVPSGVVQVGVLFRMSNPNGGLGSAQGYGVFARSASPRSRIIRWDDGFTTWSTLATEDAAVWALNDTLEYEVTATEIRLYRNGLQVTSHSGDATYSGIYQGIYEFHNGGATGAVDDAEFGHVIVGPGGGIWKEWRARLSTVSHAVQMNYAGWQTRHNHPAWATRRTPSQGP